MTDAYAPAVDPVGSALSLVVSLTCEEAMFGLCAAPGNAHDALEDLVKRRRDAHQAAIAGQRVPRMVSNDGFDAWIVDMARAIAPVCPPTWMPMAEVVAEKVTLEAGARGLRSLWSSTPSDKEVQRVKRLGSLAVRVLRAVFSADGPVDPEEARTLAALVRSLGLTEPDAAALLAEPPFSVDRLDVYGEIEAPVSRALLRGAWLAAALDGIDAHEEQVIRALGVKLNVPVVDVEYTRNEAIARVDARRLAGLAMVDAVRYALSDRQPGLGVRLASATATLTLPRRFREEALGQISQGAPVVLSQRYRGISALEKANAVGVAWAAALLEDPVISRQAVVRTRIDRLAQDLSVDPADARQAVDDMVAVALAEPAATLVPK